MTKPFDLLAKGLVSKDSRGNQTRLELFGSEFDDWPVIAMDALLDAT